ncbi:hypothetical protein DFP94_101370 [Fontibacillus phaseoli]|uniref:Uncharacterized protein n=1 Tax=Fontibacillus phaseoli TaxID=1416533 RepID=A0A369BQ96_9BACL|nr:hypothetical protein [Fontibacillus phaseoli]RCX22786.1 hypothetical protein DFP94_101370 [Fontibacillus phaseoli]
MERDKREIILREIGQWRRSRLLPEHYCDFLENLYRDEKAEPPRSLFSLGSLQQGSWKVWLLSFGLISFFFFIVFYFSFFPWPLQMGTALLVTSSCYAASGYYRHKRPTFSLVMAGAGSLLLLGMGSWIINLQGWTGDAATILLIAGCGTIWLLSGVFLQFGILDYCGFACVILLYAFFFGRLHPQASWGMLQLLWLPLSLGLFWLTWLSHHRLKRLARVCFAASLTLWFMPEADALLLRQQSAQGMELLILLKIIAAFALLFLLRKKWVVWLSS